MIFAGAHEIGPAAAAQESTAAGVAATPRRKRFRHSPQRGDAITQISRQTLLQRVILLLLAAKRLSSRKDRRPPKEMPSIRRGPIDRPSRSRCFLPSSLHWARLARENGSLAGQSRSPRPIPLMRLPQKRRSRDDRTNLHSDRPPETRVPPGVARKHRRRRLVGGVALNGKFQTLRRFTDVVCIEALDLAAFLSPSLVAMITRAPCRLAQMQGGDS